MRILHHALASGLAAGLLASFASATPQAALQKKYEEKLALEFVEHGGWVTDYDAARERAAAESKVLFVYFSRSYAP